MGKVQLNRDGTYSLSTKYDIDYDYSPRVYRQVLTTTIGFRRMFEEKGMNVGNNPVFAGPRPQPFKVIVTPPGELTVNPKRVRAEISNNETIIKKIDKWLTGADMHPLAGTQERTDRLLKERAVARQELLRLKPILKATEIS